jgi:alpha-galactosidase
MAMTRRAALRIVAAAPWLGSLRVRAAGGTGALDLDSLKASAGRVVPAGDGAGRNALRLTRKWDGPLCRSRLVNTGRAPVRIKEVVLFDVAHALPPETKLYGEGFQMLSQTGGTLGQPADLGDYSDAGHYKMPQPEGTRVVHGLLTLSPPGSDHRLLAFTSCRRFDGQLRLRPGDGRLQAAVDAEGLELAPGEEWDLEEVMFLSGPDRDALLAALAGGLTGNHPPLVRTTPEPPSGWCSWYCFGPRVTSEQVLANLDVIARSIPGLKYIQIDDGYQAAMGDWLETGGAFGGGVAAVLRQIHERGFEPAIWVAPFIAEKASRVAREHPDWLVKDGSGAPLAADKVTFGGWRHGPWFVLDGTHPEAQRHLEAVFRTMREQWGCTYFKLDANFWGAIHGGRFHDPRATRIEAYRRGMEAVRRGAGDAFLLGCNHPIWASLGLIHGSRSSNDIKRAWPRVAATARQNLRRNWQGGRLWWNDPDAVVLTGDLSEDEFLFHATAVYATGGMLLSGDDLTAIPPSRLALLRKLSPPTGAPARFEDDAFRIGEVERPGGRMFCLLNWSDAPQELSFRLARPHRVRDVWRDADLGVHGPAAVPSVLPARSGRLLACTPVQ